MLLIIPILILLHQSFAVAENPVPSHAITEDEQANSIGQLAKHLACNNCPSALSSSLRYPNKNDPSFNQTTNQPKIIINSKESCKSDSECGASGSNMLICYNGICSSPLRRPKINPKSELECGDIERAECFQQCYPPVADDRRDNDEKKDRKQMMYCSYCCLDCTCDADEQERNSVPPEVVSLLYRGTPENTNIDNDQSLRRL